VAARATVRVGRASRRPVAADPERPGVGECDAGGEAGGAVLVNGMRY
jgi:hypothetical protein